MTGTLTFEAMTSRMLSDPLGLAHLASDPLDFATLSSDPLDLAHLASSPYGGAYGAFDGDGEDEPEAE